MMREARARMAIWQKRTKSMRAQQEPGMMIVICTLLFSKFDSDVRKDVLNAAGRDATSTESGDLLRDRFRIYEEHRRKVEESRRPESAISYGAREFLRGP